MKKKFADLWRSPYFIFTVILWLKLILLRWMLFGSPFTLDSLLDLASIAVITGLAELLLPKKAKKFGYWSLNTLLSLIFFSAALYFEHFGSVVTYTAVLEIKQILQIKSSVKSTFEWNDLWFFADFVVFAVLYAAARRRGTKLFRELPLRKYTVAVLALVGFTVSAWFIRYDKNITNELVRAEGLGFLNYEASVMISGAKEDETKFTSLKQAAFVINRVERRFGYGKTPESDASPAYFASQKGKNLIVVQLEAFQNFPINLTLNGQEVTPTLNRLAKESFYFPHIFQQIGQGNTSDAEFMSNTSIYPTGTIPMSTGYGDRALPSLPKLMQQLGYEADTFHVNDVSFWDRNKLYPALGFDHYFDKPYYVNDHFNAFGASDEELFRVGVEKLNELQQQKKPFYAQFVTVSSHHPFKIPVDRRKMTIPPSLEGKQLGDYLLAVNYTDYALGKFIEQLKATGLWDTSVLVVYGDHFGLQPQDNDPKEIGETLGITYHPYVTRFNIPLMIHVPGQQEGKVIDQVGGQLDIMPTVANLLGISLREQNFVHFGQDLLNIKKNAFGMRYYLPTGSFFNDDILFVPGKGFDDGSAVSLKTLQPVTDFAKYKPDYDYVMRLMKMSDEYVKMLPKR